MCTACVIGLSDARRVLTLQALWLRCHCTSVPADASWLLQVLRKLGHLEPGLQDLNQALALLVAPNSMRAFALEQRGSVRGSLKDFQVFPSLFTCQGACSTLIKLNLIKQIDLDCYRSLQEALLATASTNNGRSPLPVWIWLSKLHRYRLLSACNVRWIPLVLQWGFQHHPSHCSRSAGRPPAIPPQCRRQLTRHADDCLPDNMRSNSRDQAGRQSQEQTHCAGATMRSTGKYYQSISKYFPSATESRKGAAPAPLQARFRPLNDPLHFQM